jgi:hypothetical protein
MAEVGGNDLVLEMIRNAVHAGGFRAAARAFPKARKTFQAMAREHSARAATLATEICIEAGRQLIDLASEPQAARND